MGISCGKDQCLAGKRWIDVVCKFFSNHSIEFGSDHLLVELLNLKLYFIGRMSEVEFAGARVEEFQLFGFLKDNAGAGQCGLNRVAHDAAVSGLQALPERAGWDGFRGWPTLPSGAAACETASWAPGTFEAAYWSNRQTAIEEVVDAGPVAACVRHLATETSEWTGSASDLLRAGLELEAVARYRGRADWPKTLRALAGRLSRAQTFLRILGVEIRFAREGRIGTRMIKIHAPTSRTSTVPSVPSATVGDDLAPQPRARYKRKSSKQADGADAKPARHAKAGLDSSVRISAALIWVAGGASHA